MYCHGLESPSLLSRCNRDECGMEVAVPSGSIVPSGSSTRRLEGLCQTED